MGLYLVPLFVSVVSFVICYLVYKRYIGHFFNVDNRYNTIYKDLISRTEGLTLRLNHAESLVMAIKEAKTLEFYESCLGRFENLLEMFRSIKPNGHDLNILHSAIYLLKDCELRVSKLDLTLKSLIKGKKTDVAKTLHPLQSRVPVGCYFCSKPFIYGGFTKVRVKVEDEVRQVYSCDSCKNTLYKKGSVSVLYFTKDGKTLHWSKVSEYNPIKDYQELRQRSSLKNRTNLQLIYSKHEEELTNSKDE